MANKPNATAPAPAPEQEAPVEDTRRMLPVMHDIRGQIARRNYSMPLPIALVEEIDRHYGKDAPAKLAAAIGPTIMALLDVRMPDNALTVKLAADQVGPATWSALQSVIGTYNRLRLPVTRAAVEEKLRAKIAASTNAAILNASTERVDKAIVRALDTYYSQRQDNTVIIDTPKNGAHTLGDEANNA